MLWIPSEVLSQILQHALRQKKNYGVVVARESPLFLAHVCGQWRSTAFSIPDIWSFINVTLTNTTISDFRNRAELQLYLSLSEGASSSMALVSKHHNIIEPFFHALVPYFPRCQSLYIDLPLPSLIALDRLVKSQSFSNLRDITFHGHIQHVWPFRAFNEAPALSSATFWGSYHLGRLVLPSSQLTSLMLHWAYKISST